MFKKRVIYLQSKFFWRTVMLRQDHSVRIGLLYIFLEFLPMQSAIKAPTDRANMIKHFDRLKDTCFELGKVKVK